MYSPLFVCVCVCVCVCVVFCVCLCFWYALLCVLSRVPIILKRKILFLLSFICSVALPHGAMGCLQCVIVVFPDHTRLLLDFTYN